MSAPIDNGGNAFPVMHPEAQLDGMSLRDWFAGQALSAVAAHTVMVEESGVAAKCYKMADAMIEARKEKP